MQTLKEVNELEFGKGMNNTDKPEFLKKGYCVLAQNCLVGDEQIKKGPGTDRLFKIVTSYPCLGGIATGSEIYTTFNESGGTLAYIYRYTGSGNPVVVGGSDATADTMMNFVDTGDATYAFNGTDATMKLVGATLTKPASIPIAKYGVWVNNRFYMAGNPTYPDRLYYSDANDPDTFGGASYIDVSPVDKSPITGLSSIGGILIIGKQDNVLSFNGYTEDDFTIKAVTDELPNFGCASYRSFINTGNDLLWLSFAGNTPHIRSLSRTSFDALNFGGTISEDIEETMKDFNTSRLNQVAGGFDGRYAYWAYPYKTDTTNTRMIIYDTFKKGWTYHTGFNANVFFRSDLVGQDRIYYGSSASDGTINYVSENASNREDSAITMKFKSRLYRPQVARKSKFKYLYVATGSDTNTSISVKFSPDGYTEELQDTLDPRPSDGTFPMTFPFRFGSSSDKRQRVNLKVEPAYTGQVILEEESMGESNLFPMTFPITFGTNTNVTIKEYSLFYYLRGLRDA